MLPRVRKLAVPLGSSSVAVAVQDAGPFSKKAPAAPPLVLLHGVGADHNEWALSLALLARSRRTLGFDLLGHGGSARPIGSDGDFRIRLLADAVVQGLHVLDVHRIDLLGHSLGGMVALDLARRFPRLIRRLVLVDAAGLHPRVAMTPVSASLPFAPHGFHDSQRLLKTSINTPLLNNALVALGAAVYKGRRTNRPQLMKLLAAIASGDDCLTRRDLSRIRQKTLVLWGDGDRVFPVATGRRLAESLPHARLEILPRCGHVPPTERPVAFGRRVTAFLSAPD